MGRVREQNKKDEIRHNVPFTLVSFYEGPHTRAALGLLLFEKVFLLTNFHRQNVRCCCGKVTLEKQRPRRIPNFEQHEMEMKQSRGNVYIKCCGNRQIPAIWQLKNIDGQLFLQTFLL